jgi:hypothetical protein
VEPKTRGTAVFLVKSDSNQWDCLFRRAGLALIVLLFGQRFVAGHFLFMDFTVARAAKSNIMRAAPRLTIDSRMKKRTKGWGFLAALAAVFLTLAVWVAPGYSGSQSQAPKEKQGQPATLPSIPAQELVRRAINNEEKASTEKVRYMYRLRTESPKGSKTQELVETSEGVVGRLIAVNDRPPSADLRTQDDEKLNMLVKDPQARAKKQKQQKEDEARVNRMVGSLPDAFVYEYDATANTSNSVVIHLKFKPNPNWTPPDRERQVFQGMSGTMLIDPNQERLVKMEATLFRDVNFGWGFFGHLDKGGQFIVEQSRVGSDRWETTDMRLHFTGKILLLKNLNINEHESASNFRPVPYDLNFAQGVDLLKKQDGMLADKQLVK